MENKPSRLSVILKLLTFFEKILYAAFVAYNAHQQKKIASLEAKIDKMKIDELVIAKKKALYDQKKKSVDIITDLLNDNNHSSK